MADVPENAPERKILCIFPFSLRDLKNWPLRFFLSDLIYFSSILTDCPGTGSEQAGKGTACQGCPNQNICSSSKPLGPDPGNLIAFRSNIKLILHTAVMKISFFPISSGEMKNWKLCIVIINMITCVCCVSHRSRLTFTLLFLRPMGQKLFPDGSSWLNEKSSLIPSKPHCDTNKRRKIKICTVIPRRQTSSWVASVFLYGKEFPGYITSAKHTQSLNESYWPDVPQISPSFSNFHSPLCSRWYPLGIFVFAIKESDLLF